MTFRSLSLFSKYRCSPGLCLGPLPYFLPVSIDFSFPCRWHTDPPNSSMSWSPPMTLSIQNIILVLQQLHWLPIKNHIGYKILLLTCKAPHNLTTFCPQISLHTLWYSSVLLHGPYYTPYLLPDHLWGRELSVIFALVSGTFLHKLSHILILAPSLHFA